MYILETHFLYLEKSDWHGELVRQKLARVAMGREGFAEIFGSNLLRISGIRLEKSSPDEMISILGKILFFRDWIHFLDCAFNQVQSPKRWTWPKC